MIHIPDNQLRQVEYFIEQSIQGNHILFGNEQILKVFKRKLENGKISFCEEDAYSVEHHFEGLLSQPSLDQKKAYLEKLDSETYDRVVLAYFNIIENNLYEAAHLNRLPH